MSKTTKVNVVKIDTDPATTSLKDLRQKLKEFKEKIGRKHKIVEMNRAGMR